MFFFFNDTATTEIYTLSLHDALPISPPSIPLLGGQAEVFGARPGCDDERIAGVVARIARETQRACGEIDGLHVVIDDLGRESFGVPAHPLHERRPLQTLHITRPVVDVRRGHELPALFDSRDEQR